MPQPWLIGAGATYCLLTPINVSAAGVVSEVGAAALYLRNPSDPYGVVDAVEIELNNTLENISPMDRSFANHVLIEQAFSITLTEIMQNSGGNYLASRIMQAGASYSRFKLQLKRGDMGYRFFCIVRSYREQIVKGKCVATATFDIIDTGGVTASTVNPRYDANPDAAN